MQTFLIGPIFKGLKMIPPGIHLISYASSNAQGSFAPTTAFFIHLHASQVAAWRWNPQDEILSPITNHNEDELTRLTTTVKSYQLDQHLAPYDIASHNIWNMLSNKISDQVLDKIAPIGGNINMLQDVCSTQRGRSMTKAEQALEQHLQEGRKAFEEKRASIQSSTTAVEQMEEEIHADVPIRVDTMTEEDNVSLQQQQRDSMGAPGSTTQAATSTATRASPSSAAAPHAGRCYFTPLPRLIKRAGLSPADLTALNLDKTKTLLELFSTKYNHDRKSFIGEFQFAYLSFLVGHSLDGFLQWKSFLTLMFSCEDAVTVLSFPDRNHEDGSSMSTLPVVSEQEEHKDAIIALFVDFLDAFHAQVFYTLQDSPHDNTTALNNNNNNITMMMDVSDTHPSMGYGTLNTDAETRDEQQHGGGGISSSSLLGAPIVDELMHDSFLRRKCTQWLRWVLYEHTTTAPAPAPAVPSQTVVIPEKIVAAAQRVARVLKHVVRWDCQRMIVELKGIVAAGNHSLTRDEYLEDDEDGPVVVDDIPEEYVMM